MATIPQYTRDNLVSPVVGTPGVDTSSQQIDQSIAQTGEKIASLGFDYAIARQQQRDVADANSLLTQYKLASINTLEQHMKDYAGNPEQSGPLFAQSLKDNLQATANLSPNDRVKEMVQKGDPYFDGHMLMQQGTWAAKQDEHNIISNANSTINDLGVKAKLLGEDTTLTNEEKMKQLNGYTSALGSAVTSIKNSRRPDLAEKVQLTGLKSIARGLIGGTLNTNPMAAMNLIERPQMKEIFTEKELGQMSAGVDANLKSFAAKQNWKVVSSDLHDHPETVSDVLTGKKTWVDIDNMQKHAGDDLSPLKLQTFDYLKKLALSSSPQQSEAEQAVVHDRFLDEAHQLNIDVPNKTPKENVDGLMKFSNDLIDAKVRGVISAADFGRLHKEIATPLIASVLKKYDPQGFQGWLAKQFAHQEPLDKVKNSDQGLATISNYMLRVGMDKSPDYYDKKKGLIIQYLNTMDGKLNNPEVRDITGQPYTPASLAHEIMRTRIGDMIPTKHGLRKINGYDQFGVPTYETTKEDEELLKGPLGQLKSGK